MQDVLISGAGVAGTALAHLLARRGFDVTVVERWPGRRDGGHAVDVRGVALDVLAGMGLLEAVRELRTAYRGMSVVDGDGCELFRSTESTYSAGRIDGADVEVLRADLVRVLTDATPVAYRYGDSIAALAEHAAGVRVTFESGDERDFALVVGADGLHSRVRRLVFGPEKEFVHPMGRHIGIYSAENFLGLEDWQVWHREGEAGFGVFTAPGNARLTVFAGFGGDLPDGFDHRDVEAARSLIAERCGALRWEAPRLLKGLAEADDLYFDTMAQVKMDRWSAGRVVLIGDAAHCPSPLSGQGASLSLVGAHVLAGELAAGDSHAAAFDRYETRMRPFVALNQALALENPEGPASQESTDKAKNAIAL